MTDADLARLSQDAYTALPGPSTATYRDTLATVTDLNGTAVVAFRGTLVSSLENLIRDAQAWPTMCREHLALGPCHAGFLEGAEGLLPGLAPLVAGKPVVVTGHSLGGSMAVLYSALMTAAGTPPELVVTFEAAKAGGAQLKRLLALVKGRQYRYGDDPVTEVPWAPGLYEHPWEPLIHIGKALPDPLSCHSIDGITTWLETHP